MAANKIVTTKKKPLSLKAAYRKMYKEIEARWEGADCEGDSLRCEHLNDLLEDLTQEFGAI